MTSLNGNMKAVEFIANIVKGNIKIPLKIQRELKSGNEKKVRVIILFEEPEKSVEVGFQNFVAEEFLKGYSETDKIYDNY